MGRGKLTMELIEKEKARMITYQKRKKGLKKKAQEFSILCGVPTCLIIYLPKQKNRPADIDCWPKERKDVMEVINLYREKAFSSHGIKPQTLFDFFSSRKRKVVDKISKLHKASLEAKFPRRWDDRFNSFSVDELKVLLATFDTKIEVARRKIAMLKGEQNLMECSESWALGGCNSSNQLYLSNSSNQLYLNPPNHHSQVLFRKNMELEVISRQPISSVKPLDMQPTPYYPSDQADLQMVPFDFSPIENPMTIMMMNGDDFNQSGGTCGGNMAYTQQQHPLYFDPTAAMLDNVMLNNPRTMCFYGSTMQPLPFDQFPVLPSVSSQMLGSQINEFYHGHQRIWNKE